MFDVCEAILFNYSGLSSSSGFLDCTSSISSINLATMQQATVRNTVVRLPGAQRLPVNIAVQHALNVRLRVVRTVILDERVRVQHVRPDLRIQHLM
jgi:hypothetical protein